MLWFSCQIAFNLAWHAAGLGSAIAAAALLAKESQQPLSLGRVRPM